MELCARDLLVLSGTIPISVWGKPNWAEQEIKLKCSCNSDLSWNHKSSTGMAFLISSLHSEKKHNLGQASSLPWKVILIEVLQWELSANTPRCWGMSVSLLKQAEGEDLTMHHGIHSDLILNIDYKEWFLSPSKTHLYPLVMIPK